MQIQHAPRMQSFLDAYEHIMRLPDEDFSTLRRYALLGLFQNIWDEAMAHAIDEGEEEIRV
jgi:hypothetical protein